MSTKLLDLWTNQVGNGYCPQVHLEIWKTSEDDTKVYFDWYMYYDAYGYAAYTNGNARSVTVTSSNADISFSGSININGITGTKLINSGSSWLWKTHSNRWVSISLTFGIDVTWGSTYAATTSASGGFSLTPQTSYTISYNANGGTGAPGSQTKWHDENLTLSSTKPTRTGYSFQGWGTSASDTSVDYAAGATYSANSGRTLYAIWKANTYTVTYNANGGSGGPGSQTKTYGVDLTLSTTKPTRTNYNFLGWSTNINAVAAEYSSGGKYKNNAAVTLYAVWELAYWKPKITNLKASRTSKVDGSYVLDDFGPYAKVTFDYECCQLLGENKSTAIKIVCNGVTSNITAGKTSSSPIWNVGGSLSVEQSYDIEVTVTDSKNGSTTATTSVGAAIFPLDILNEGKGIAFGKPATTANVVDSAWPYRTNDRYVAYVDSTSQLRETSAIASGADLDTMLTPGTYACYNAVADTLTNCPVAKAFRMEISYSYGDNSYVTQRIFVPYDEIEYARRYNKSASTWSSWKSDFAADTGWLTLNNQIKYRRIGKVVFVKGESSNAVSLASGSYTTVGTLPAGFRPNGQSMPFTYDCVGGSMWTQSAYVSTDGKIDMYHKEGEAKAYWRFGVSFPTDTSA